jgi:anti-sigma factor RsiW
MLDALIDNELGPDEQLAVRTHVEACKQCAATLASLQSLRVSIKSARDVVGAPQDLRARLRRAGRESNRSTGSWRIVSYALAASILIAAGLAAGVMLARQPGANMLATSEVVSAHVRSLMANHLLDVVSTDQHTVKPWFEGKLDFAPPVKELSPQGFPLIGGRLEYIDGHTVAALVYRRNQHTINLFISPQPLQQSNESQQQGGLSIVSWQQNELSFCAVSTLNLNDLKKFAADFRASPTTQPH